MTDVEETDSSDLVERLRVIFAASDQECQALLAGAVDSPSAAALAARVGLEENDVERILSSRAELEKTRVDVNLVRERQLENLPGLPRHKIREILGGKPYFSISELANVTGIASDRLAVYLSLPLLTFRDGITGAELQLEPVDDKYVILPPRDFEAVHLLEDAGFSEVPADRGAPIRVVVKRDDESFQNSHRLKSSLGGRVYPVLKDPEGFERYLVPGQIDVWFKKEIQASDARRILGELGLREKSSRPRIGYYHVELGVLPSDMHVTVETLRKIEQAQKYVEVSFAEPTEVGFEDFGSPNETAMSEFEDSGGDNRLWNLESINLDEAHQVTTGGPNVVVIVVDSGLRLEHQDLAKSLFPGWETLDLNFDLGVPEEELSPSEQYISHGTKVAGLVGGRAPSGTSRIKGISPGCWILPVKISGTPFGQSYGLRAAAIQECVQYLQEGNRGIINISWSTNGEHIGIREALFEASANDFVIVTSAGNFGADENHTADRPHYPSKYACLPGGTDAEPSVRTKIKGLASVAAVNSSGRKASYSYFGSTSITISAPGGESGSAGHAIFVASTPNAYSYDAGTSFAAPHVAGVAALILSLKPELDNQSVIDLMTVTAINIDTENPGYEGMLGAGLVDAARALHSATDGLPTDSNEQPVNLNDNVAALAPSVEVYPVNINIASMDDLMTVPFIGKWAAQKILSFRENNGPFSTVDELTLCGALDQWLVDQIREYVVAGPVNTEFESHGIRKSSRDAVGPVNINAADSEVIRTLPFLGPWSAAAIVNYRKRNGDFSSIGRLVSTGAVDNWVLEKISHLLTVY